MWRHVTITSDDMNQTEKNSVNSFFVKDRSVTLKTTLTRRNAIRLASFVRSIFYQEEYFGVWIDAHRI